VLGRRNIRRPLDYNPSGIRARYVGDCYGRQCYSFTNVSNIPKHVVSALGGRLDTMWKGFWRVGQSWRPCRGMRCAVQSMTKRIMKGGSTLLRNFENDQLHRVTRLVLLLICPLSPSGDWYPTRGAGWESRARQSSTTIRIFHHHGPRVVFKHFLSCHEKNYMQWCVVRCTASEPSSVSALGSVHMGVSIHIRP
jgi:hypothetical protein